MRQRMWVASRNWKRQRKKERKKANEQTDKPEKARKQILPQNLQKEHSPADPF